MIYRKIIKVLTNQEAASYLLRNVLLKIPRLNNVFSYSKEYRSDSDDGKYPATISKFLQNQRSFNNFKRNWQYNSILEHVSNKQGNLYLNIVKSRNDGLLDIALKTVLLSDTTGNPKKFRYDGIDIPISPTTIRYVKVASDLKLLFGANFEKIAEIGCGYGGQCLVNDKLLGYKHVTLFDMPIVNQLINKYLNYTLMDGAYEAVTINEKLPESYDLVISNYAFSELPAIVQMMYINKVIVNSKRGYLTMNSGLGGDRSLGKLKLEMLKEILPKFECIEEKPLTSKHNYIIVWGHDSDVLDKFFIRKLV